jgi:hypothetical protein
MKQDWVVWLGCAVLFCAGVIWGAVPIETNFFKVKDIHDLSEIFSSIATIIAVCLAFIGVNAWRLQVRGEADHELARRVAIAALKYKNVARTSFYDVQFALRPSYHDLWMQPVEVLSRHAINMKSSRQQCLDYKAELSTVLLECRVLWGVEFTKKYDGLFEFVGSIESYLLFFWKLIDQGENGALTEMCKTALQEGYKKFDKENWLMVPPFELPQFDQLTQDADEFLKKKLLREK